MRLFPTSLGGRLLAGSALFTLVALAFTLVLMHQVLQRFVSGQIDQRLDNKIVALASQLRADPDGTLHLDGDADGPPFDKPHHLSFWWVHGPRNDLKTGWLKTSDFTPPAFNAGLPRPPVEVGDGAADPRARTLNAAGPAGIPMYVRAAHRRVGETAVAIYVAAPEAAIEGPMREAMTTIGLGTVGLGLALVLATLAQIRVGLHPLKRLQGDVAAVRDGARARLPLNQPVEVLPLVIEMNALLAENAENLVRARRHVANLAHGLKTPLATLALSIERVEDAERGALRVLVDSIDRRIRHHLGRARAAALGGAVRVRTPVAERLRDLAAILDRIYAAKTVSFTLDCPDALTLACEPHDFDEIMGNVLDNAFKFATHQVVCTARLLQDRVEVVIRDDGSGLTEAEIDRVLQPGERLDEGVPGFGFGLTIARELTELYGGAILLQDTGAPGLEVKVTFPRAWPV